MKKAISLLCLLLAALMLLSACNNEPQSTTPAETTPEPTTPEPLEPTTPEQTTPEPPEQTTPEQTTPEPEPIVPEEPAPMPKKILAIGNSFSVDAMQHLAEILVGEGYTDFVLGNLYVGGCTLDGHKSRIDSGAANYTFYVNTGTGWSSSTRSIQYGLTYADWDLITVQQASGSSGIADTYSNLEYIVNYAKSMVNNPEVKVYWHMTWAYQGNSTHSEFPKYGNNQMKMYEAIVQALKSEVLPHSFIDGVIPSGTAIQNLRSSYLGDTLTRDGYHLSNDIGRYTAALVWYKTLMGADLTDLTVTPATFPNVERHLPAIKEAVNNAIAKPFEVTSATVSGPTGPEETIPDFTVMTETDRAYLLGRGLNPDKFEVLDLGYTFWAYYYSNNKATATLLPNESNSSQFIATKLFTPQTLPVGSIIHVLEGYRYRPEGWQTAGAKNAAARPGNYTTDMVIDAAWYSTYNIRAFNVSHASGGGSVRYEDGWGFRIYVPKEPEFDPSLSENDKTYLSGLGLDPNNYEKLDLDYTLFAYYFSTNNTTSNLMSVETCVENNLINFISTKLISKDEMPVGSVIRLNDGYQFRPERFVELGVSPATRGENTYAGCVIDDAWWSNYQYVGFNVSTKSPSADFVATPETGTNFVIYVPIAD